MVPAIAGFFWRLKRLAPRFVLNLIARRNVSGTTQAGQKELAGSR